MTGDVVPRLQSSPGVSNKDLFGGLARMMLGGRNCHIQELFHADRTSR